MSLIFQCLFISQSFLTNVGELLKSYNHAFIKSEKACMVNSLSILMYFAFRQYIRDDKFRKGIFVW